LFNILIIIWGLGIGDWGLGPIPNPQSPIPNPQFIKSINNLTINQFYSNNNYFNNRIYNIVYCFYLLLIYNNKFLYKNEFQTRKDKEGDDETNGNDT